MNAATGTVLVLPARAADLKRLHAMAAEQLGGLLQVCGIGGALAEAELDALREPFAFARNGNRSLVASMNQRRHEAWTQFAYNRLTAFDVALRTDRKNGGSGTTGVGRVDSGGRRLIKKQKTQ